MKRFSTVSRVMPATLNSASAAATAIVAAARRSIRRANHAVIAAVTSRAARGAPGLHSTSAAGNSVKVSTKPMPRPMTIIQPKSMTGRIPLTINDANAIIVVIAVYRQGTNMCRTVSRTSVR